MTSLVIAEHDNASIKSATLNTVTAAVACGGDVHVLVTGENAAAAAQAAAQIAGVAKVIHADGASLRDGLAENLAAQILAIVESGAGNYSHILFPSTASGKNTAPRVAAKLDVAQISDITKVDSPDTGTGTHPTAKVSDLGNIWRATQESCRRMPSAGITRCIVTAQSSRPGAGRMRGASSTTCTSWIAHQLPRKHCAASGRYMPLNARFAARHRTCACLRASCTRLHCSLN